MSKASDLKIKTIFHTIFCNKISGDSLYGLKEYSR